MKIITRYRVISTEAKIDISYVSTLREKRWDTDLYPGGKQKQLVALLRFHICRELCLKLFFLQWVLNRQKKSIFNLKKENGFKLKASKQVWIYHCSRWRVSCQTTTNNKEELGHWVQYEISDKTIKQCGTFFYLDFITKLWKSPQECGGKWKVVKSSSNKVIKTCFLPLMWTFEKVLCQQFTLLNCNTRDVNTTFNVQIHVHYYIIIL